MSKSETALLREELVRMAAENEELARSVRRYKAEFEERVAALEAEVDRLTLEVAERDRRLAKYENPHAPSSTDSLYNKRRASFRKEQMGGGGDEGRPEPGGGRPARRGPPAGHAGTSHKNRADRTVVLGVERRWRCRRGHLRRLPFVVKLVCDFAGGGSTVWRPSHTWWEGGCARSAACARMRDVG